MAPSRQRRGRKLPARLRPLFWDYRFGVLRWETDRELVIGRVLAHGDWNAIRWLRRRAGELVLKEWLMRRHGGGLPPEKLRYWQLILGLPRRTVDAWLRDPRRAVWDHRGQA
jgi:hypothetical protein